MEEGDEEWDEELQGPRTPRGSRVIVHLDLDCFYAQVEMLRNPELKDKPLGVQQKSLVVTCNYEARKIGIRKLMPVWDAKEKCPELVLVKGEDLTPYREMSYKVTELLREFCPLVERLGLDENFVDVTDLVGKKFQELEFDHSQIQVCGHVYNQQGINRKDPQHIRLILGSHVALEFRNSLKSRLGITGCAGIASNKLLAKLISRIFKPDQQTVLFPENHQDLLSNLENLQELPGIGPRTRQRLESLGVRKVWELRDFPAALLEKEFGASGARKLWNLSFGKDDSPVTPSGPPQSISDEDSFKKCSSEAEVKEKIRELLPNLLDRISKDGRKPQTIRLTIRKVSFGKIHRESRQCSIPSHLIPKFGKGNASLVPPLVDILMKLLGKMIPLEFPFHLTLLSICFSNFQEILTRKSSISFYLDRDGVGKEGISSGNAEKSGNFPEENDGKDVAIPAVPGVSSPDSSGIFLPPGVDPEVFRELPMELREELREEWRKRENSQGKFPGNPKGKRRKNPGSSSQSNSLLRYFQSRDFSTPGKKT